MTLLTHIWNGNQTIIAGDGREMLNGRIDRDNIQKIFINKKQRLAVGLGGRMPDIPGWKADLFLHHLLNEKKVDMSLNRFSNSVKRNFEKIDDNIHAQVIVGGFDQFGQQAYAIPLNQIPKINDKKANSIGFRTSSDGTEHQQILTKLFKDIFKSNFGELSRDEKKFLNEKKIYNFLNEFYDKVHKTKKANPRKTIGPTADFFLITRTKTVCLRNDNEIDLW